MALLFNPADRAIALVMLVYLVYVLISLVRSHAEYQQRLDLDQELRDQRDLFAQQSKIDPLTELANRRHFADVLAEAATHALRTGEPLTLLVLDLDHFKKINDTHGHAIGDACLSPSQGGCDAASARRRPAGAARRRGVRRPARRPGPGHGARARRTFPRGLSYRHPIALDDVVLAMTASIGIAEFDKTRHRDVDELYSAADRAVYRAKAAGRNRVCRDEADEPASVIADS